MGPDHKGAREIYRYMYILLKTFPCLALSTSMCNTLNKATRRFPITINDFPPCRCCAWRFLLKVTVRHEGCRVSQIRALSKQQWTVGSVQTRNKQRVLDWRMSDFEIEIGKHGLEVEAKGKALFWIVTATFLTGLAVGVYVGYKGGHKIDKFKKR